MASTLWLCLCLVLLVHNLIELMSDRYLLSYKIVEKGDVFFDEDHDLNYLACTPFWVIKAENSLTYEQATQIVSVKSFLNHSVASIERRLNVAGLFRLNESHIFNYHVCFPTTKTELEKGDEEGKPFNRFLRIYGFQNIFIYSKEKQPNFYEMAYKKDDRHRSIYLRAYKQKVFGVNHLLNPDCSNRAHQIHHDRFSCLNRCLKELKMEAIFYRFNDEGTFNLGHILKEKRIGKRQTNNEEDALEIFKKVPTPSAFEGVERCRRRCPERSCFWEVVITLKIDRDYHFQYLRKEKKVNLQLNTYVAFYSMDDFYLQLFGLLVLFTGTSVLKLLHALLSLVLPVASRKIEPLLKNEKFLRIFRLVLPNLKHLLTLPCLVLVLVQGLSMVNEFRFHSSHPNRTSSLNFSSGPFSVVICFPILDYKEHSYILRNFSFNSMEAASKRLSARWIKSIDFFSGNKPIESKFKISDEVLFKSSEYYDRLWLFRCFPVDFDLDERHRKMPLTHFIMKFNTKFREIFLIERGQNFTSGLVNFRGLFNPQKVTKIHSKSSVKSNCRDYSKEPNCGSRRNCLDWCLSTRHIEKHSSIPPNTVVSSSHLNSTWLNRSIYFNETVDKKIEAKCSALFNQADCNEAHFEESPDRVSPKSEVDSLVFIRLSYLNIVEREMEYDPLKTLLDIIRLETVLFGSNALGLLTTVLLFFRRTLRLKWRRAYSAFLLLLASAGSLVHNVLIFRTIISGDLQENEFFEKPERFTLPSPILCFPIEKKVDENHRLSGEYLDHLTSGLTFQHAFREIRYNNRTHLKSLVIRRLNSTKSSRFYSSPELELTYFYYLGMKCFKISLKVSYTEEDFLLLTDKTVLKIYLDRSFANKIGDTTFLHQQADSREIRGGFNYSIGKPNPNAHYQYMIEFEQFRIVREDQFEQLKDPRWLFQEMVKVNDPKTGEVMKKRFKEDHNRTTEHLPLDENFDAEVDNELYEQYVKTATKNSVFKSLDFEQNIANTYTNVYYAPFSHNSPHFSFSFSFLVRRVVITNRENYTKLVVSLLNTLSLWLDICVIDMGAWFSSFFSLAFHLYLLLINISNCLDRLKD